MSAPVDDAHYSTTTESHGLPQSPSLAFGNYQNEPINRPACCPTALVKFPGSREFRLLKLLSVFGCFQNPLYILLPATLVWVKTVKLAGEVPVTLFYSITFPSVGKPDHCTIARVSVLMSVNLLVYAARHHDESNE
ncbi:hypothetical protein A7U60_g6280 [Sanghuangporus baumii]|uniref:Uncharacterized protein n=1 Tax=Sanghuangporus baumii TaxID=108892 RepID=A0A9Q5HVL3_SANBA|nr:hypothetical protein A7U60_g6280 [Sanghuangporus baumii]